MGTLCTGGGDGCTSFGCDLGHGSTAVNTRTVAKWKRKDKGNQGLWSFTATKEGWSGELHSQVKKRERQRGLSTLEGGRRDRGQRKCRG